MRKMFLIILLAAFSFAIYSCGEKKAVVEIKDLKTYSDPGFGFGINYPSNWMSQNLLGDRFLTYTSKEGLKRFRKYDAEGEAAAKIEIMALKLNEGQTIDTVMARKFFEPSQYSAPAPVAIDGVKGFKQTYSFDLNDGVFNGEIYYAQKDPTVVTVITFEAFGGTFDKYKDKFAEILNSVKLAAVQERKVDTVKKVVEAPPPSSNLVNSKGEGFSIMVPDNFDIKSPKISGALKSYLFTGERRADCDIRVDIFDASKGKLDKIAQDNKSKHGNAEPKATTFAGEKAYQFEYSPVAQVKSRVFYVVKNAKLFRITMNWFAGEEASYKPIFEKSLSSFKFQ